MSRWCALLDELVDAHGGEDEVAARFCAISRRDSGANYLAAKRSLSNWLAGAAVPQRKNYQILTRALKVEDDKEKFAQWKALYAQARDRGPSADAQADVPASVDAPMPIPVPFRQRLPRWSIGMALAVIVAGGLGYAMLASAGDDSPTIGYLPFAELKVGESVLVHAKRGECGKPPPEWREIEHEIPVLKTGRLVDDGLGTSRSTTCGGLTPGRLVRFEAQYPGEEVFELFQRQIKVVVLP